ncbi:MAG TPA: sigma-70 family RNA polymerase sigma factor [Enterococcus columbae]|nr:sigma-70 family RNA polymerase sigma factor [Enterococcus columbae]
MHEKAEKMKPYEQEQLITQYQGMMHKILYRLAINHNHPDYEDYLQVLNIQLWHISKNYQTITEFKQAYPINRLWQLMYWRAQDYRRTLLKLPNPLDEIQLYHLLDQSNSTTQSDENILLKQFIEHLTAKEQQQLIKLYTHNTSRQLRAYYRQKLYKRYQEFVQDIR